MTKKIKHFKKNAAKLVLIIAGFAAGYTTHQQLVEIPPMPLEHEDQVAVFFSPRGGCTEAIVQAIEQADTTICVYAFAFTSKSIADALGRAIERGIEVTILADREQSQHPWSQLPHLQKEGAAIFLDKVAGLSHNKVMILDGTAVLTGSFNWSKAAETRNRENLLIIKKKKLAARYLHNWQRALKKAIPYVGYENSLHK